LCFSHGYLWLKQTYTNAFGEELVKDLQGYDFGFPNGFTGARWNTILCDLLHLFGKNEASREVKTHARVILQPLVQLS